MDFGTVMKKRREALGLTLEDVAISGTITSDEWAEWELGKLYRDTTPSYNLVACVAHKLHLPVEIALRANGLCDPQMKSQSVDQLMEPNTSERLDSYDFRTFWRLELMLLSFEHEARCGVAMLHGATGGRMEAVHLLCLAVSASQLARSLGAERMRLAREEK